jgi:hypothetical protein
MHAGSFHEACTKWTSRGVAFIYWNLLLGPTFDRLAGQLPLAIARYHLNKEETPSLKDAAPESYQHIEGILQQEGLPSLEGYTIKKGYAGLTKEWANFGNKTILIPHSAFVPVVNGTSNSKNTLHTIADCETAAAILAHETEHSRKKHVGKRALLTAAATIPVIMFAQKVGNHCIFNKLPHGSYPTIMKSLLRIPLAFGAILPVYYLDAWYSRRTEREADAVLKNSPKLALKYSEFIKREQLPIDTKFKDSQNAVWNNVHNGNAHSVSLTNRLLATMLSKDRFVAFKKYNADILNTHPSAEERIAYLEEWARTT